MLKRASGHVARSNMRLFLWCVMVIAALAIGSCAWLAEPGSGVAFGVGIWCGASVALSAIISGVIAGRSSEKRDSLHGCLGKFRRPPVMFEVLRCVAPTNWLILMLWFALLPGEVTASFVLWPIVLLVRAMANPVPGRWE